MTGGFIGDISVLEEVDYSYNPVGRGFGLLAPFPRLRKINASHTNINEVYMVSTPRLTHLDVSGNSLTNLDLRGLSRSLEVLKCSGNPLANLSLSYSPNLNSVDCLNINFDKSNTNHPTSSIVTTETVLVNNPALSVGLGIPLGISMLG